jgi:hypothetical protein
MDNLVFYCILGFIIACGYMLAYDAPCKNSAWGRLGMTMLAWAISDFAIMVVTANSITILVSKESLEVQPMWPFLAGTASIAAAICTLAYVQGRKSKSLHRS